MRPQVTTRDVRMQLGPYRVVDLLGEGATGIVYRAADPNNRELAIKVLREELALSDRERARFLAEADRLRRVRHPALVEVVDAGVLPNGLPYIAMPYLHGASLSERLQRGPMRFDVALHLFEQLAGALQTLHREGLVHRDIKPENIFVTDGDGHAMLLDLGIARDVASGPSTTTHAGMIRGTPAYMAPERFFGSPATPATDIYELGVVLYLTLVGALPWLRFDDPTERMRPASPASRGVILPPRLSSTLMRALAVSPGDRPVSADDFASAVIDALSPESAQQISNQATAFLPSHMVMRAARTPSYSSSAPSTHADVYAPTAMSAVQGHVPPTTPGTGVRPHATAAEWAPASSSAPRTHPSQLQSRPYSEREPTKPKRGPSGLLVAAMTGASLIGVGALSLVLFFRGGGSASSVASGAGAPVAAAEPIASPAPVRTDPAPVDAVAANATKTASNPKARVAKAVASQATIGDSAKPTPAAVATKTPADIGPQKPVADAGAAAKAKLLQPPPRVFPSTSLENCRILASYECLPQMQAALTPGVCVSSTQQLSMASKFPEEGKRGLDGGCAGKLSDYERRYQEQERKSLP